MIDLIKELQEKNAFMEYTLEKLNGVLVEHADHFDRLNKEVAFLKDRLLNLEQGSDGPADAPPPHY